MLVTLSWISYVLPFSMRYRHTGLGFRMHGFSEPKGFVIVGKTLILSEPKFKFCSEHRNVSYYNFSLSSKTQMHKHTQLLS